MTDVIQMNAGKKSRPCKLNGVSAHDIVNHTNNRAVLSHRSTRARKLGIRRFHSVRQAQRFLGVHPAVYNLSNLRRNLISTEKYPPLKQHVFNRWSEAMVHASLVDLSNLQKLS